MKKSTAKKTKATTPAANEPAKKKRAEFTVPETYRSIEKKNEKQADGKYYDVLVCGHAVEADASTRENTFRKARACVSCRTAVQAIVDAEDLEERGWYGVRR